ncbi:MAG: AbrB/MazE/SpoVT family DNA-binding domain-containing protein [Bacillota bacterium]
MLFLHGGKKIMYKIKVTSKGQVTIPKKLREEMGLQPGDYLEVKESATDGYLIKKKVERKKIEKYVGILNKEKSSDEIVRELRGYDSSN